MKSYMNCRIVFKNEEEFTYMDSMSGHKIEGKVLTSDGQNQTMAKFHQWISEFNAKLTPANSRLPWEIFGYHIYQFLFVEGSPEKAAFETLLSNFLTEKKSDPTLRLLVDLEFQPGADSLGSIPWEFLFIPALNAGKGAFWAQVGSGIILNRYFSASETTPLSAESSPLRVLIAGPIPSDSFQPKAEKIIKEIRKLHENQRISINYLLSNETDQKSRPTEEAIKRELATFQPHVFLFIGQILGGKFGLTEEAETFAQTSLRDQTLPGIHWISTEEFLELFSYKPTVNCFIPLEAGKEPLSSAFSDKGWRLMCENLPSVGSVQFDISPEDVVAFSKAFLRALGDGADMGESLKIGRQELANVLAYGRSSWGSRSFGTPVFWFNVKADQALILREGSIVSDEHKSDESQEKINRCPSCGHFTQKGQNRCVNISCRHKLIDCPVCGELMSATAGICLTCSHRVGEVELTPRAIQRKAASRKTLSTPSMTRTMGVNGFSDLPVSVQHPMEATIPNDNS
ncbi:MAG: hypothetical protein AAGC85_18945 [Bacteroidota bacterium]